MTARIPDPREYSHDRLGARFADVVCDYDTTRRLETLVDEFLSDAIVSGRDVLDVGSGLGFFSERLVARGGRVVACDIGPRMVEMTRARAGCDAVVSDALALGDRFGRDRFDVVVSSECIEHTPAPTIAIAQMIEVLKPGGLLSLSTPNVLWWPVVRAATVVGARPYDALENFSSWRELRRAIERNGASVIAARGLHLFPFQFGLHRFSRWCDRRLQCFRGAMINICVLARKRA